MKLNWTDIGKTFFSGMLIHSAPGLLKGAMQEFLWKVELDQLVVMVRNDAKIWDALHEDQRKAIMRIAPRIGSLDWLTVEWIMDSGRESAPALWSAIISWDEAQEWLERQIIDVKGRIGGN